ncbi:MAG: NADH-quinone oxidoreductase subunit B family protein [candidate division WOR-3 bacterium]|nr:NADH-quinone oxidoreductase subunit B family protein [candidate division WOR-3 bacterium]MCX7837345.1 NADH-quinone oxidoreductase subunit B family protein [candidate division WOR-3 bacterium]MDW8113815.1 NADH-quinone oxidoreductase subunit B family protein [candidate division WOR-3 bacterium]
MSIKLKALKKSPWVFHVSAASCNNCDIEILAALTPRFDVERFGILLVGSPRHADALLVTGVINRKTLPRVLEVYNQTPKPCLVIAIGTCACDCHMFKDSYNVVGPYDKYLPVDVYIPGCPPRPEAIIAGIVKALNKL